jgi:hypothetical protein
MLPSGSPPRQIPAFPEAAMRHLGRRLARRLVAPLSLLLVAAPAFAGAPPGAETPQALVARLRQAAEKKDLAEMMACLAPDARREMALMMVAGVGMMVAFMGMGEGMADMAGDMAEGISGEELSAEQKAQMEAGKKEMADKAAALTKRYEGILERHGVSAMMEDDGPLPEDPAARSAALAKLFAGTDDIALVTELMALMSELGEGKGEAPSPVSLPPEVGDYAISGDRATARAGDETIHFVRVDGRWYFLPEDRSGAGSGAAASPDAGGT